MVILETYQEQCQNRPDVNCASVGILCGGHTSPKSQRHYGSEKCTLMTLKHSATITYLLQPQLNIGTLSKLQNIFLKVRKVLIFSCSGRYHHCRLISKNEFCWCTSWMRQTTLLSLELTRVRNSNIWSKSRWANKKMKYSNTGKQNSCRILGSFIVNYYAVPYVQ